MFLIWRYIIFTNEYQKVLNFQATRAKLHDSNELRSRERV